METKHYEGQLSTDQDDRDRKIGHRLATNNKQDIEQLISAQIGIGTTQIVKLICQMIGDLQRGRTCNS